MNAVIKLAGGDMRRCLNVMQACHLAYPEVNEESVYTCTGKPLPKDIETILKLLLNSSIKEAFEGISKMQVEKGISLQDVVTLLHEVATRCSFPPKVHFQKKTS